MSLIPYLFFSGNCAQAIEFYQNALGAEVLRKTTRADISADDRPGANSGCAPDLPPDAIVNALLRIGGSEMMVSDGNGASQPHSGFSLSLSPESLEKGERWFNALSDGGEINMDWQETFWAYGFGMLKDKFGVSWMVSFNKPH